MNEPIGGVDANGTVDTQPPDYWRGHIGGQWARVNSLDRSVFYLSVATICFGVAFLMHLKVGHGA